MHRSLFSAPIGASSRTGHRRRWALALVLSVLATLLSPTILNPTPAAAASTATLLYSGTSGFRDPLVSHSGTVLAVPVTSATEDGVRVSTDQGATWQTILLPAGISLPQMAVNDAGELFGIKNAAGCTGWCPLDFFRYQNGAWQGPIRISSSGSTSWTSQPGFLTTDGTTFFAAESNSGRIFRSTDNGTTWSQGSILSYDNLSTAKTLILGNVLHIYASYGDGQSRYYRYDATTGQKLTIQTPPTGLGSQAKSIITPTRSTTELYLTGYSGTAQVSIMRSADSGLNWTPIALGEFLPTAFGSAGAFTSAMDGQLHAFGMTYSAGSVTVRHMSRTPVVETQDWTSLHRSLNTSVYVDSAYLASVQQSNAGQPTAPRSFAFVRTTSGYYDVYLLAGIGETEAEASATTFSSRPPDVLRDSNNLRFSENVVAASPGRTWEAAVVDTTAGAYIVRSQNGSTWDKIPRPASASIVNLGIADNGEVYVTTRSGTSPPTAFYKFTNNRWWGPSRFGYNVGPFELHVLPGQLIATQKDYGDIYHSLDGGKSWLYGGGVGTNSLHANNLKSAVVGTVGPGQTLHALWNNHLGDWLYNRVDLTTATRPAVTTRPAIPRGGRSFVLPQRRVPGSVWIVNVTSSTLRLYYTSDNGANWALVATDTIPSFVNDTPVATLGSDDRVYLFGTATSGALRRISRDLYTAEWTPPVTIATGAELYGASLSVAEASVQHDHLPPGVWFHTNSGGAVVRHYGQLGGFPPIPVPQLLGTAFGFAIRPVGFQSDPVNTATGNFVTSANDLALPGVGLGLAFERSYNSLDATAGALGRGWTHSYAASLTVDGFSGDVTLRSGDGQQVFYSKLSDGSYGMPAGGRAKLVKNADGTYVITTRAQLKYAFDTSGRLASVKDRNGQGPALSYDAGGRLSSIAVAGRSVSVTTDPATGLITRLTLVDGTYVQYGYTDGLLTSVRDLGGGTWNYGYDAGRRLTSIQDPNGHYTARQVYDATTGRVTDQWDARDNHATFSWDAATQTATMTAPRGGTWKDVYVDNVLVKQIDPAGKTTEYTYDVNFNLVMLKDARGKTSQLQYDAAGNIVWEKGPDGAVKSYTYDALNNQTSSKNSNGTTVTYAYDAKGNFTGTSRPNPAGGAAITTLQTLDPATGLVLSSRDPRNKTTTFTYNASGDLLSATSPMGNKSTFTYDALGTRVSTVTPRGNAAGAVADDHRSATVYDSARRELLSLIALGSPATDTFTRANASSLGTAETGRPWQALIGTWGVVNGAAYLASAGGTANLATLPSAANGTIGATVLAHQDGAGLTFRVQDSSNYWRVVAKPGTSNWSLVKRVRNKETQVGTTPAGTCCTTGQRVAVTTNGNSIAVTLDGQVKLSASDSALATATGVGLFAAAAGPARFDSLFTHSSLGTLTTSTHDAVGNLLTSRDAKGNVSTFVYNAADQVVSAQGPDPTIAPTIMDYNADGQLRSRIDANGRTTTFDYDLSDRLTSVASPAGTWQFGYDELGNRTSVTDPTNAVTTMAYDGASRLSGVAYPDATPPVSWTYDGNGNRKTMTDGLGTKSYTYDALDRLTSVTRGADVYQYGYDEAGNVTSLTAPGQPTQTLTYDDDSREATVASEGVTHAAYAYNADSQLQTTTLPVANGHVSTRAYDRAGRLTEVKDAKGAVTLSKSTYTLDANGNPTSVVNALGITTSFTYDALDRLTQACFMTSCAAATDYVRWTYDGVGNRKTETRPTGTTTYAYDTADRLQSATGPAGATTFDYDGVGNRTRAGASTFTWNKAGRQTSSTVDGTTTSYAYDGEGRRTSATAGSSSVGFDWDPLTYDLAAERDGAGTTLRRYVYGAGRVAMQVPGTGGGTGTFYYHGDALNSVLAVTDAAGATQWQHEWEPYGLSRTTTRVSPTAPANPMQWAGEYRDPTGLVHLRARMYDPATGSFASVDAGGTGDAYGYASANPMVLTDPLGLWSLRGAVKWVNKAARSVAAVAGTAAMVCAAVVVCAPVAPVLGGVALAAGAITAGTSLYMAYDACTSHKGSCVGALLTAALDTTAVLGGIGAYRAVSATQTNTVGRISSRVDELHGALDVQAQTRRTTAVLATKEGPDVLAAGTRDLSPAQRALAKGDDILAKAPGSHAEVTALKAAAANGVTPDAIATSWNICPTCQRVLTDAGATLTGPRTAVW